MAANAIIAPDLTLLETNAAIAQVLGYKPSQIIGHNVLEFIVPEQQEQAAHAMQAAFAGHATPAMEVDMIGTRGRRTFWFVEGHAPIYDNGKVIAIAVSGIDITDRKAAEDALRRSELQYRTLEESAGAYIAILDRRLRFTYANTANRINFVSFNKPLGEVIGASLYDVFPHAVARDRVRRLREVIRTGEAVVFEESAKIDGTVRWYSTSFKPMKDPDGKTIAIMVVALDTTESRQMRSALWESQQRLQSVLNSLHLTCMLVVDPNARYLAIWCGPELEDRYGLKMRELVGKTMYDWPGMMKEDVEYRMELMRKIIAHGSIFREEVPLTTPNGMFWQDFTASPLNDAAGKPYAVLIVSRDIQDRKGIEEALRASETHYRGMVESQTDLVVRVDLQGRYTFVNDAYCTKFGKSRQELLGLTYTPLVHTDDLPATLETVRKVMQPPYRGSVEQRAMTAQGWRWIAWEDSAILDADGQVVEVQAVGRDVTASRQVQDDLQQAHRKLMSAREEERRRVAMELHDGISQSLVAMQIHLSQTLSFCPNCPNKDRLGGVSSRCAGIISDVRSLCQGLYPPTLEDLGLASAIRRLAQDAAAKMHVRVSISPKLAEHRFDRDVEIALFRICQEAIANAVRHSKSSVLALSLTRRVKSVVLRVRDQGVGFSPVLARGRGLGLTTMRERAFSIGATLSLTSQPGDTVVEVEMPLQQPMANSQ